MKYPNMIQIGSQKIKVNVYDTPQYQWFECPVCASVNGPGQKYRFPLPYGEDNPRCPACKSEHVQPRHNSVIYGEFKPTDNSIHVMHLDEYEDMFGVNFVHEVIEAADCINDLNLNHTQITALGSALYQAFSTGRVNFTPVSEVAEAA